MSRLDFQRKRSEVLPDLRPMYKISNILLVLKICCLGEKSSLLKLHLFNWALLDEDRLKALKISAEKKDLLTGVWGIDPSFNMALGYAVGEGLVAKINKNGSYKLTDKGNKFIDVGQLFSLFEERVADLKIISKKITEKMVSDTSNRWKNEI